MLSIKPDASTVSTGTNEADPYVPAVTVVFADLLKSAVIIPALKLPDASRVTIADPVFAFVAVVAEF